MKIEGMWGAKVEGESRVIQLFNIINGISNLKTFLGKFTATKEENRK